MDSNTFIIFDFDSTFVKGETLEQLIELSIAKDPRRNEILEKIRIITTKGMNGEIPFEESLRKRIRLCRVTRESVKRLANILKSSVSESFARNKEFIRENADKIYVISGGFYDYMEETIYDFYIPENHIYANRFNYDKQDNVIGFDAENPLGRSGGKAAIVKALGLRGTIYMVGDGYSDYEVKKYGAADHFIAFTENIARSKVIAQADKVCNNFEELLRYI